MFEVIPRDGRVSRRRHLGVLLFILSSSRELVRAAGHAPVIERETFYLTSSPILCWFSRVHGIINWFLIERDRLGRHVQGTSVLPVRTASKKCLGETQGRAVSNSLMRR